MTEKGFQDGVPEAGRTLAVRFGGVEAPAAASPLEWIEELVSRLPFHLTLAIVEHAFGVVPLLAEAFDTPFEAVRRGDELAALGLFTPNAELSWNAAALHGERHGRKVLLYGEARIPSALAESTLVLARLDGDGDRLALAAHGDKGVERRGRGNGEACWLSFDGAELGPERVSRPVKVASSNGDPPDGCRRRLDEYAAAYALAASLYAVRGVRELRRAARTTLRGATARGPAPLNRSQVVAMGITEVEIEVDLAAAAVRTRFETGGGEPAGSGLLLAAAAARALSAVAAKTAELTGKAGLECGGPFADDADLKLVDVFLGGQLMVESELASSIDL